LHRNNPEINKGMTKSYILITALTLAARPVAFAQSDKSITIHQEIDFSASPQRLYEALLNSKQFSEFSGRPAEINGEVGVPFRSSKGISSAGTWNWSRIKGSSRPGAW